MGRWKKKGTSRPWNIWLWMNLLKNRRRSLQKWKNHPKSFWLFWTFSMCLYSNKGKPQHKTRRQPSLWAALQKVWVPPEMRIPPRRPSRQGS
jgi:hypothetical protein